MDSAILDAGRSPKPPAPSTINRGEAAAQPRRGRWVFFAMAAVYAAWLAALAVAASISSLS